eukprot:292322-Chlamydomonas_euryale.AAC.12
MRVTAAISSRALALRTVGAYLVIPHYCPHTSLWVQCGPGCPSCRRRPDQVRPVRTVPRKGPQRPPGSLKRGAPPPPPLNSTTQHSAAGTQVRKNRNLSNSSSSSSSSRAAVAAAAAAALASGELARCTQPSRMEAIMARRQREAEAAAEAQWDGGQGAFHPDFDPEAMGMPEFAKASRETEELYLAVVKDDVAEVRAAGRDS